VKKLIILVALAWFAIAGCFADKLSPLGKYKIDDQFKLDLCLVKIPSNSVEFSGKSLLDLITTGELDRIINKKGVVEKYLIHSYPEATLMLNEETVIQNITSISSKGAKSKKVGTYIKAKPERKKDKLKTTVAIRHEQVTDVKKVFKDEYPVYSGQLKTLKIAGSDGKWDASVFTSKNDSEDSTIWTLVCARIYPVKEK